MANQEKRWLSHLQKNLIIGLLIVLLISTIAYFKVPQYLAHQRTLSLKSAFLAYKNAPKNTPQEKQVAQQVFYTSVPKSALIPMSAQADDGDWCGVIVPVIEQVIGDTVEPGWAHDLFIMAIEDNCISYYGPILAD